jgi:hypothetical protein
VHHFSFQESRRLLVRSRAARVLRQLANNNLYSKPLTVILEIDTGLFQRRKFALARRCPDLLDVLDVDATPAVQDHSSFLQFARDIRHAGAPHANHLGEKLLGQWKVDTSEIVHPQKPHANAGLQVVNRIAGSRLLHLRKKELLVFYQELPKVRNGEIARPLRAYHGGSARDLHHDAMREPVVEGLVRAESAVDHARLDGVAAG